MCRLNCIILSVLILFSCQQTGREPISEEEVNSLVGKWLNLWSTYDVDQLGDIFWNNESMTYFSSEKKGLIVGYDKMKPHHEGFGFVSGGKQPSKSLWLEEQKVTTHNDCAVVEAIWYFGDRTIPKDSVQNGPVTFVILRENNGTLKIAHTHFGNYD